MAPVDDRFGGHLSTLNFSFSFSFSYSYSCSCSFHLDSAVDVIVHLDVDAMHYTLTLLTVLSPLI